MNSKIDQAVGGIKKAVGSAIGDEKMHAEGMAQSTKGQAGQQIDHAGQQLEHGKDELKNRLGGNSNNNTDNNTDNNNGNLKQDDWGVC